jgi:hypothetical protein
MAHIVLAVDLKCKKLDCKWRTPRRSTQTLSRHSSVSERHTVSRYTRTCNFIYAYKKVRPPIHRFSRSFKNSEQHYAQISHAEFKQNWKINVEGNDRALFMALGTISHLTVVHKFHAYPTTFYETPIPNFNENSTNGLVADTVSRTDGQTAYPHKTMVFI